MANKKKTIEDEEELEEEDTRSDEELLADSARIAEEKLAQEEKKKLERQNSPVMFSESKVREMIQEALLKSRADSRKEEEDMDVEELFKQKTLSIPRWQNKFILGFENTNTDEYMPELVVHAYDVFNQEKRQYEPYVEVKFEDGTTAQLPLYTIITRSLKIDVDIVEIIDEDASYSDGRVEVAEVKEYSRKGTGVYKKLKVTQANYKYKVRLPSGKEVIVGPEVINWAPGQRNY